MRTVVVGHTVFTLAMFGLMWAVQVVVYPQFRSVAADDFAAYAAGHSTRISVALAVLAPAEVVFAGWLFLDAPVGLNRALVFVAGALLALGWISTAFYFGPLHGEFQRGHDPEAIERLIRFNWLRTGLWTLRAAVAGWFLWQLLEPATTRAA